MRMYTFPYSYILLSISIFLYASNMFMNTSYLDPHDPILCGMKDMKMPSCLTMLDVLKPQIMKASIESNFVFKDNDEQ